MRSPEAHALSMRCSVWPPASRAMRWVRPRVVAGNGEPVPGQEVTRYSGAKSCMQTPWVG